MKLLTVKEYAAHIGKSIPLVYKQIEEEKVQTVKKYGRILVKLREREPKELQVIEREPFIIGKIGHESQNCKG